MCDSGGAEDVEKTLVVACIPAYNEEGRVGGVVVRAMKHVDKVVVCDDGSGDLTGEIAGGLGAIVVRHERNRGLHCGVIFIKRSAYTLNLGVTLFLWGFK